MIDPAPIRRTPVKILPIMKILRTFLPAMLLLATSCNTGIKELPDWAIGPFSRPETGNPVIMPHSTLTFDCPMRGESVRWAEGAAFNPAAIMLGDSIAVLFRSEDDLSQGIGTRTSRLGMALSADGVRMDIKPTPVLYPDDDAQKGYEWPGGCEDPRIAITEDGLYVCLYTQWNHSCPRLAVATSKDLRHWDKHGPAFAKAYDGKFRDIPTKSASIVTELKGGRLVIRRFGEPGPYDGKYIMYWGEAFVNLAVSDNLTDWTPLTGEEGELLKIMEPRDGFFDSGLTECGPPAVYTPKGIVLIYNGKNRGDEKMDPKISPNAYCPGEALFDKDDPLKLIERLDIPVLKPEADFERTGQYAAGTVFSEGLVYRKGKWFLYYGCADSRVGVAICSR